MLPFDSIGYHAFQGCDLLEDLCNSDSEGENGLVYEDLVYCSVFFYFIGPAILNLIFLFIIEFVWGTRIRPFGHAYKRSINVIDILNNSDSIFDLCFYSYSLFNNTCLFKEMIIHINKIQI